MKKLLILILNVICGFFVVVAYPFTLLRYHLIKSNLDIIQGFDFNDDENFDDQSE